ncbi:FeoC-like transcriptional regulator [Neiella marina]|uniref:FeoC-like transcriptional regulator n=1 Tax=Neiella holothuriorum TaxID=2870530 RepID=A0ABS7EJ53_9GAMM|nr:FeoC-like transcriptional regulator [Neiella holothuriorum]MBW8192364.1 FeoC-like transcriptional regulator [Neiella holothuriorum]
MLHDLVALLQDKGPLSQAMIARELKASEPAVADMLNLLVKRGRIKRLSADACDGGCCSSAGVEMFQWQGEQALPLVSKLD